MNPYTELQTKKITHITCKNALSVSRLSGLDYSLNPYKGCAHACRYCYAPSILHEDREWGSFIEVKENIPKVLYKELRNLCKISKFSKGSKCSSKVIKPSLYSNKIENIKMENNKIENNKMEKASKKVSIGIGTVTDAYQNIEKKELLTRYCLEQISKFDFKVVIQTKSALVLRDLDLISKMNNVEVGFTVTSLSKKKIFEPGVENTPEDNLFKCARAFSEAGVPVFFFIGPVLPKVTLHDLDAILYLIKESGARTIMADRLRLDKSYGTWDIKQNLIKAYENAGIDISLDDKTCENEFMNAKNKILEFCKENKISFQE